MIVRLDHWTGSSLRPSHNLQSQRVDLFETSPMIPSRIIRKMSRATAPVPPLPAPVPVRPALGRLRPSAQVPLPTDGPALRPGRPATCQNLRAEALIPIMVPDILPEQLLP